MLESLMMSGAPTENISDVPVDTIASTAFPVATYPIATAASPPATGTSGSNVETSGSNVEAFRMLGRLPTLSVTRPSLTTAGFGLASRTAARAQSREAKKKKKKLETVATVQSLTGPTNVGGIGGAVTASEAPVITVDCPAEFLCAINKHIMKCPVRFLSCVCH
jgi:hypothetical protein